MQTFVWSPELAYAVGLMATDGNLSSDGRHLELTSKDIEQLHTFKRCLNLKNRITLKKSGSGILCSRVQFGNVKLYRWLLGIGLMPCKSLKLGTLTIPDRFFFDFLRGALDGDGSIRTFQDPVYPNSRRLYVTFISGSRPHLEWIQQQIAGLIQKKGFMRRGTGVWNLTYAKKASSSLLKAIYYRRGLRCLQRKFRIAEPFL